MINDYEFHSELSVDWIYQMWAGMKVKDSFADFELMAFYIIHIFDLGAAG